MGCVLGEGESGKRGLVWYGWWTRLHWRHSGVWLEVGAVSR